MRRKTNETGTDKRERVAAVLEKFGLKVKRLPGGIYEAVRSGESGWVSQRWVLTARGLSWQARVSPMHAWTEMAFENFDRIDMVLKAMRAVKRRDRMQAVSCGHLKRVA